MMPSMVMRCFGSATSSRSSRETQSVLICTCVSSLQQNSGITLQEVCHLRLREISRSVGFSFVNPATDEKKMGTCTDSKVHLAEHQQLQNEDTSFGNPQRCMIQSYLQSISGYCGETQTCRNEAMLFRMRSSLHANMRSTIAKNELASLQQTTAGQHRIGPCFIPMEGCSFDIVCMNLMHHARCHDGS